MKYFKIKMAKNFSKPTKNINLQIQKANCKWHKYKKNYT